MSRKYRIFAPMFGFDPDSNLGGEVYDVTLLTELARRGHTIEAVLMKGQKAPLMKNVNVHYLPFRMKAWMFSLFVLPWLFMTRKMRKVLGACDVFRVHSPYFMAVGAAFARKTGICPPVWYNYNMIEKSLKMRVFDKVMPRYCDGVTTVSNDELEHLKAVCHSAKGKVSGVVYNSIDTGIFRPAPSGIRKDLGIGPDEVVMIYVGLLIHRKGIDVVLRTWKRLSSEFPNLHMIIIGRGPYAKEVSGMAKETGRLHYFDYVGSRETLAGYYNSADMFIFPTRKESFGLVVAEAMACGLPVITTRARGVRYVVTDECGFRVTVDDEDEFAEKARMLIKNKSLRKGMGEKAAARVRNEFTAESNAEKAEDFLRRLVKNDKD